MTKFIIIGCSIFIILIMGGFIVYRKQNPPSSPPSPTADIQKNSVPVEQTQTSKDPSETEVLAKNLEVPWALAFLPNGRLLVTERKGTIKLLSKDFKDIKEVGKINVKQVGEGGLHGIAPHPNFINNNFIYLYYTYSGDGNKTLNRVVRTRLENNILMDEEIIVDDIPGAPNHNGGRIKFGPDGYLYITTGDAQEPSLAQDKNSLAGKILRVTSEGKTPPNNPFNNLVFSYGHRNPQGITWDQDGDLWETEHGQNATDEVNKISLGKNYGWPIIRGDELKTGFDNPIEHSGTDTWAPAGLAYYKGWSFFFGGLRGQALYQLNVNGEYPDLKTHFKGRFGRIRDVVLGPDQMLYITTSNRDGRGNPSPDDDKIIRINPNKL